MNEHRNNCVVCGEELDYLESPVKKECFFCGKIFDSEVACKSGHFVCDECHSSSATTFIFNFCVKEEKCSDPLLLADLIMDNKIIKMHGPEHHFLVPAVLLTCYYNQLNDQKTKKEKLLIARKRSSKVLGGFCGFYGSCGAAVGTGIFISLITNSTPLSSGGWRLSNLITSDVLRVIAENGGPRCCKRSTFLAILGAVKFLKNHFRIEFNADGNIKCRYNSLNKECKKEDCSFFDIAKTKQ